LAAVLVRPWRRAALGVALAFAVVLAWWLTLPPSNDREWQPDVARLPTATLDGSLLTMPFARRMRRSGPAPISVGPSHTLIADNPHA
jgi:hypothetical protein